MKRVAIVLVTFFVFFVPTTFADNPIAEIASKLKQSPVYVDLRTEGVDKDTQGKLLARLNPGENFALVMLPSSAETEVGADITTIASRLSEQLGNQRIIGLAIGRKLVGYAPSLPVGVATDQMRRADSVSNDSQTALITYVQNIRLWQRDYSVTTPTPTPKSTPTPVPPAPKKEEGVEDLLPLAFVIVLLVLTGLTWLIVRYAVMVQVLLTKIDEQTNLVKDQTLRRALIEVVSDTRKYLKSYSRGLRRDYRIFHGHLRTVDQILTKYLDVQDYSRYYERPDNLLAQGKQALVDFRDYLLASIRRGRDADLEEFRFKVDIMAARRDFQRTQF